MHVLGGDSKRLRAAAISMSIGLLPLVGAAQAHAALIHTCPAPSSLKAAAGTALTVETSKAGMDVFCHYTHPLSTILQDSVSIAVEPLSGSDAAFERQAMAFAKDLKAPFRRLSGIGSEAWEYTEPKSTLDAEGLPTTTVTIVVGEREVTVISNIPAKNALAVARQVS
jgi:hypothetical protein